MCTSVERCAWSYAWDVMDDLSAVPQDSVIDFLLERLRRGKIYTWINSILLAINPSNEVITESIYDLSRVDKYHNASSVTYKEITPHIFSVAARAHYRIIQGIGKPSQVIVLNGETGTGKTFNAWKALEFLTVNTRNLSADIGKHDTTFCSIMQRIKDACHLISAFTTAPTEKNEVSSRHVQLVWLLYKKGKICGAKISSYLLERERVTKSCCNFQIFSQMMTALTEFPDTGLSENKQYYMLSDLGSLKKQDLHDRLQDTLKAMDVLGFTEDQRKDIFQVLSLLIHMSNIRFIEGDDHCRIDTDNDQSREALENTCKLTCLEEEDVAELLTSILINPQSSWRRHSIYRRNLKTNDDCRHRLNSIIRHLYDLLFHWLVRFVNNILSTCSSENDERLGILDIFGFECFGTNGIEQLCVNYVNEKLQQYFVDRYLECCRKDLQEEGLIDDEQPSEIVQLYEDRICTIERQLFDILNDMCQSTLANNSSVLIHAKSHSVTRRFLKVRNENFVIQHYANAVEYSAKDLLSKNTDKVPNEIGVTFSKSRNAFLCSLVTEDKSYRDDNTVKQRVEIAKKSTMLSKLRYNVALLIQELDKCDMHYIRCVKPRNNLFIDALMIAIGTGMSFVNNWSIRAFLMLCICPNVNTQFALRIKNFLNAIPEDVQNLSTDLSTESCDLNVACKKILGLFRSTTSNDNDNNSPIYYGKNLIFFTNPTFLQLESERRLRHVECIKKIESFWIKHRRKKIQTAAVHIKDMQQSKIEQTHAPRDFDITKSDIPLSPWRNEDDDIFISDYDQKDQITSFAEERILSTPSYQLHDVKENIVSDVEEIVNMNIQSELDAKKQNKALQIASSELHDVGTYIMSWLREIIKITNITKNTGLLILEKQQVGHDYNQFIDINCHKYNIQPQNTWNIHSNNGIFHTQHMDTFKNFEGLPYYNKEEDIYVISHGTSTLFYRNRILSRRRLTKIPLKVHTRHTCLTNSHYLVHTLLPRGLQDCL